MRWCLLCSFILTLGAVFTAIYGALIELLLCEKQTLDTLLAGFLNGRVEVV